MRTPKLVRDLMRPDPAGMGDLRRIERALCGQANAEAEARFGAITSDNAQEMIDWQTARISELCRDVHRQMVALAKQNRSR